MPCANSSPTKQIWAFKHVHQLDYTTTSFGDFCEVWKFVLSIFNRVEQSWPCRVGGGDHKIGTNACNTLMAAPPLAQPRCTPCNPTMPKMPHHLQCCKAYNITPLAMLHHLQYRNACDFHTACNWWCGAGPQMFWGRFSDVLLQILRCSDAGPWMVWCRSLGGAMHVPECANCRNGKTVKESKSTLGKNVWTIL